MTGLPKGHGYLLVRYTHPWPALLPVGAVLGVWELTAYVWGWDYVEAHFDGALSVVDAVKATRRIVYGAPGCTFQSLRDHGLDRPPSGGFETAYVVHDPAVLAAWVGQVRDVFVLGGDWRAFGGDWRVESP